MNRKLLIAIAAVVILGVAVAGWIQAWVSAAKQPAASTALPPATAMIIKTTLVETRTLPGTLGYGDPVPVTGTVAGTLTWIAPVGSIVKRGEPLFNVDERPVVALYGSVPLYRTLRDNVAGATHGTDIRQLKENLAELGYTGFTVDDTYTSAAAAAVRTWQADLGLPETGTVEPGQVVFTPATVRIAEHTARVGDILGERGVPVLTYTDTTRLVTIGLDVANQALAVEGRKVTVKVPGREEAEGKISKVGTVITGGANQGNARIRVTVTIADQEALGSLDAAPVDVDFISEERKDVLAAPIAALLALAEGGFGVEIVDGATRRIVPVKTGTFAAGRVEVSGEGIAEGVTVVVPN